MQAFIYSSELLDGDDSIRSFLSTVAFVNGKTYFLGVDFGDFRSSLFVSMFLSARIRTRFEFFCSTTSLNEILYLHVLSSLPRIPISLGTVLINPYVPGTEQFVTMLLKSKSEGHFHHPGLFFMRCPSVPNPETASRTFRHLTFFPLFSFSLIFGQKNRIIEYRILIDSTRID